MTFLELEELCKKRRLKKNIKNLLIGAVFAGIGIWTYCNIALDNQKIEKKSFEKYKVSTVMPTKPKVEFNSSKKESKPQVKIVKKEIVKKEIKKSVPKLTLILDLNDTDSHPKKPPANKHFSKKQPTKQISKKSKTLKSETNTTNTRKKSLFTMKATTLPPFEVCIVLSKKYYKKGDYQSALKWAKNANIQNNKKPDSWIMSAKSLYKLGKRKEALKILKIYYNYRKDKEVLRLIKAYSENN